MAGLPLVNTEVRITSINVDGRRVPDLSELGQSGIFQDDAHPVIARPLFGADREERCDAEPWLARKRWPNEDPIGKQWKDGKDIVVGVVGNTRAMELNNTDATEIYYPPTTEILAEMSVLVKTGAIKTMCRRRSSRLLAESTAVIPHYASSPPASHRSFPRWSKYATIITYSEAFRAIFLAVVGLLRKLCRIATDKRDCDPAGAWGPPQ